MRLQRHVPLLTSTLKRVPVRSSLSPLPSRWNHRHYASSSAAYPERIAILGGGISGLSTAHFVGKEFPNSKITIYEGQKESGGWLRSRRVQVPGGDVVFEYGPRSLRPGIYSYPTAQIIVDLGLVDDVVFTSKDSLAAKNRFIYYPDRLNRMLNGSILADFWNTLSLVQSGVLDGAQNIVAELWQPRRPSSMTDESIGDFVSRRIDKRIAQNMLSALMHGIYAGDIWRLSARSLLPLLWHLEGQYNSVLGGILQLNMNDQRGSMVVPSHPHDFADAKAMQEEFKGDWAQKFMDGLSDCSTFSFKNGLQQLSQTLQDSLEKNKQVDIKMGTPVQSFTMSKDSPEQVQVIAGEDASQTTENYDLVLSTLRQPSLTPYVTVQTVNLFYSTPNLIPVTGFGYLIPQSVPFEQNPERALGVIFDSDAITGQDTVEGTKITVMLGGHWWDGWEGYPDNDEGAELAKSVIQRHLGITEEPVACHVQLHRDCIPQYTVGYEERLKQHGEKLQQEFKGKVRVVGNQYNGVGVNDCVRGAWSLARALRGNGWKSRDCGLGKVMDTSPWVVEPVPKLLLPAKLEKDL